MLLVETEAIFNPYAIISEAVRQFVREFAVSFFQEDFFKKLTHFTKFKYLKHFFSSQMFTRDQALKIANMMQEEIEKLRNQ